MFRFLFCFEKICIDVWRLLILTQKTAPCEAAFILLKGASALLLFLFFWRGDIIICVRRCGIVVIVFFIVIIKVCGNADVYFVFILVA